jgi:hypothetical protein
MELDNPELQTYEDTEFTIELRERHAEALTGLLADGELSVDVAEEMKAAFEEAVAHIQRQMASCYIALPAEFGPRDDLVQRIGALEAIAEEGEIEADTVRQMRAALERDIAWLSEFHAGGAPGEWEDVEADEASIEAARILVELLLGNGE